MTYIKTYTGPYDRRPEGSMAIKPLKCRYTGDSKVIGKLEEAIERCGLKNGDTISFHHHFREGDQILLRVVEAIDAMGIKNIKIAASSLANVHDPLIQYIENGTINRLSTSGLRGELGKYISNGNMDEPVIIRSHGGRARAIESGEELIDIAFIGAPSSDDYGNVSGKGENTICGAMGYAKVDADFAKNVIILTDNIVPYPNYPAAIDQTKVDYVVKVETVGDQNGIAKGATRFSQNPKELKIAKLAADFIASTSLFKEGFSYQTGSGGSSLAVTRFLREHMLKRDVKASFMLGGITKPIVDLYREGLVKHLFDVQTFDLDSCNSIFENDNHHEITASMYANPHNLGAFVNKLDIVVLSALEIDTDFNINVITGSNGVLRGASGGHSDTAAGSKICIVVVPLIRGRIPSIVPKVNTVITPGETVDVVVTERGIAINPLRVDLINELKGSRLPIVAIEQLCSMASDLVGDPKPIEFGDKTVALIEYRDGSIIDIVKNVI